MKNIIMTAAIFCCTMTTTVLTACRESEEELQAKLVGTWTERNDLYNDVLTLNEDATFTFRSTATAPNYQSHANLYNGSGSYKYEFYLASDIKQNQDLRVRKLTNSKLEMTNYNGDIFRFSR